MIYVRTYRALIYRCHPLKSFAHDAIPSSHAACIVRLPDLLWQGMELLAVLPIEKLWRFGPDSWEKWEELMYLCIYIYIYMY